MPDNESNPLLRGTLWLASGAAWLLLAWPRQVMPMAAMNPPHPPLIHLLPLERHWLLMLAAMMLPLLFTPLEHLSDRTFPRRRPRAFALFLAGYLAVWTLAGASLLLPRKVVTASTTLLLAAVWQSTPLRQVCLNRCHALPPIAAFGLAADRAALGFGLAQGSWCVGSCLAWMLALMLTPGAAQAVHLAAMLLLSCLLFAERIEPPAPPRWGFRLPQQAARVLARAAKAKAHALFARRGLWSLIRSFPSRSL